MRLRSLQTVSLMLVSVAGLAGCGAPRPTETLPVAGAEMPVDRSSPSLLGGPEDGGALQTAWFAGWRTPDALEPADAQPAAPGDDPSSTGSLTSRWLSRWTTSDRFEPIELAGGPDHAETASPGVVATRPTATPDVAGIEALGGVTPVPAAILSLAPEAPSADDPQMQASVISTPETPSRPATAADSQWASAASESEPGPDLDVADAPPFLEAATEGGIFDLFDRPSPSTPTRATTTVAQSTVGVADIRKFLARFIAERATLWGADALRPGDEAEVVLTIPAELAAELSARANGAGLGSTLTAPTLSAVLTGAGHRIGPAARSLAPLTAGRSTRLSWWVTPQAQQTGRLTAEVALSFGSPEQRRTLALGTVESGLRVPSRSSAPLWLWLASGGALLATAGAATHLALRRWRARASRFAAIGVVDYARLSAPAVAGIEARAA